MDLQASLAKVRVLRSSKIPVQARQAALLDAVESALRAEGQDSNAVAYFASLLSLLERSETAEGAMSLLAYVVPHVPHSLLASKLDIVVARLLPVLLSENREADTALVRSAIAVLDAVLTSIETPAWSVPITEMGAQRTFSGVLTLAQDSRPKIRRRALEAVQHILEEGNPGKLGSKLAVDAALTAVSTAEDKALNHALQLLRNVIVALPVTLTNAQLDDVCSGLLNAARTSDQFVVLAAFEVFDSLFQSEKQSSLAKGVSELLLGLVPPPTDKQLAPAWFAVVVRAFSAWDSVAELPRVFGTVTPYLASPPASQEVAESAGQCLIGLISEVLSAAPPNVALLQEIAQTHLFPLLQVQFHATWAIVCEVIAVFIAILPFEVAPKLQGVQDIVRVVGTLRGNLGGRPADQVLGAAIRVLGPELVCEKLVPMQLDARAGGGRVWLLPLLAEHVSHTNLAYFFDSLVPQAIHFEQLAANTHDRQAKILHTVAEQIYSLFPRFCDECTDVSVVFSQPESLQRVLEWLYARPQMRPGVCSGLKLLVTSPVDESSQQFIVERYGNDILKALLNVFEAMPVDSRGYVLETAEAYIALLPAADVVQLFNQVSTMLAQNLTNQTGHTMMDIVNTLVSHLDASPETNQIFFNLFKAVAGLDDALMQKKAYRALATFGESNEDFEQYVDVVCGVLLELQPSVAASARRTRLQALTAAVDSLPEDGDFSFVFKTLPEAIIATKDVNEKTRDAAFSLLVLEGQRMALGRGYVDHGRLPELPDNEKPPVSINEFFEMIMAGLMGSTPHMIAATATALSRVLYEFASKLEQAKLEEYVDIVWMLLENPNREIVAAVLGFVKVSILIMPLPMLEARLAPLLSGLVTWSSEHKNYFKGKVRHIIERLVRRCGQDAVAAVFPEDHKSMLKNIVKNKERSRRNKAKEDPNTAGSQPQEKERKFDNEFDEALYGSSSDFESDDESLSRPKQPKKKAGARQSQYLVTSDEPLDLLGESALSHISSSKPQKAPERKMKNALQESKDGRLIIGKNRAEEEMKAATADALGAYMDAVKSGPVRTQQGKLKFKRGKRAGNNDNDDDSDDELDDHDKTSLRPKLKGSKVSKGNSKKKGGLKKQMMKRRGL